MNKPSLLCIFALFITHASFAAHLLLGPLLGHVDDTSAGIWCALDSKATLTVKVAESADLKDARTIDLSNFEMGTFRVQDLKPGKTYYYQAIASKHSKSPVFQFRTPAEIPKKNLRILFSSCSGKSGYDEAASWQDITKLKDLDLIFTLGDNHYADTTDPAIITKHYASHRSLPAFRDVTASVPTYGIWDDHDYGPNNSDGQTKGKEDSLAIFKKHWPNPTFGEPDNPGIYFTFTRGDVQFIMLDSRYHRTPNKSMKTNDPKKVMLGEKQFSWLEKTLKASTAKIKIIACGSEFQRHGSSDGFSGFRTEQTKVLDLINSIEGTICISGDRHFTAGYQIRGETIEITSGPLGSRSYPSRPSQDRFYGHSIGKMFSTFDIDTSTDTPSIKWEVHQTNKGIIHTQTFTWPQINGKEQLPRK